MARNPFRQMQGRIENSRRSRRVSRLVLGTKIDDPLEFFGTTTTTAAAALTSTSTSKEEETTGTAFDSIVVEASDGKLHHAGDDGYSYSFSVAFGRGNGLNLGDGDDNGESENCDGENGDGDGDKTPATTTTTTTTTRMAMKLLDRDDGSGETLFRIHEHDPEKKEQNNPCWEELQPLLKEGANHVAFCCIHHDDNDDDKNESGHENVQFARADIWLWKECDKVVISDIDGTITKSNARGVLGTILTNQYAAASHSGICHLLSEIATPEESPSSSSSSSTKRVVYLTSRPIHLANKTRKFLSGLTQQQQRQQQQQDDDDDAPGNGLPEGPLLGFGGNLARVLAMEVLSKSTQAFKAGELEKHIAGPFRRCARNNQDTTQQEEERRNDDDSNSSKDSIFVAAFGNNLNDVQAYHKIGVDLDKIFMIDKNSRIVTFDKLNKAPKISPPPRKGDGDESSFPPHSWYKDCIGAVFENGYSDKNLLFLLGV